MQDPALTLIQSVPDNASLALFAERLASWLIADLNKSEERVPDFTESRAKALLRAADLLDDPTLHSFTRLVEDPPAVRVAVYDLLRESGVAGADEVTTLVAAVRQSPVPDRQPTIPWLSLTIAAYAWKNGYLLYQLDPSAPPTSDSPAGLLLRRAAHFIRRQVQRTATERDKLLSKLDRPSTARSLEELEPSSAAIPPLPPVFRPPIPVRYPEVARETLHVDPEETSQAAARPVSRGEPLVITDEDLPPAGESRPAPVTNPPLSISREEATPERRQPPSPLPRTAVVMPNSSIESRPHFTMAIRQMLGQEEMKTAKLRIKVQEFPDGPGLYGLQVRISCQGIKSSVAGTTDREGNFICELPVRLHTGLTYDVDVTWPRDVGGDTERKSITLNADRTEFSLPFYRRLNP